MDRISQPFAIAFDALDDVWVNNGYSNLTIYAQELVVPIVSFNDNSNFIPALRPQGICCAWWKYGHTEL
jgi:hypothetical protein